MNFELRGAATPHHKTHFKISRTNFRIPRRILGLNVLSPVKLKIDFGCTCCGFTWTENEFANTCCFFVSDPACRFSIGFPSHHLKRNKSVGICLVVMRHLNCFCSNTAALNIHPLSCVNINRQPGNRRKDS